MNAEMPPGRQALRLVEAMLFASAEPLSERDLAERLPVGSDVPALLAQLQGECAPRGVQLARAGAGWSFVTAADLSPLLARERRVEKKLSRAAIETLAVIAYHQPVTRGEIEEIRGVQLSKGTLDALFEHGWIEPRGRRETPGRPVTWVITDGFLRHFGLSTTAELPNIEELRAAGLLDARPAIRVLQPDGGDEPGVPSAVAEPLDPDGG
ncbi:MAG: SMC-Scp complex subunit ScpB [Rhodospirillales bacterium]